MKLQVYSSDGSSSQETEFGDIATFEGNKGIQAVKEAVVAYEANQRQGDASTKSRSEVRASGKKPWRQKGTGMARAGSKASPIWVGGGVAFGPRPRDYTKKVNRKVKALALKRAFYDRASAGDVRVIESISVNPAKTRTMDALLRKVAPEGNVLLVDHDFGADTVLATRNLARVNMQEASRVTTFDLTLYDTILFTQAALESFVARMKGGQS